MGERKSEGTLRASRSSIGQEQIGPASIADDFNPSVNSQSSSLIRICRSGSFARRIKQLRWNARVNFSSVFTVCSGFSNGCPRLQ